MRSALSTALWLSMSLAFACTTYDSSLLIDEPAGGTAGAAGGEVGGGQGGAPVAGASGAGMSAAGAGSAGVGGAGAGHAGASNGGTGGGGGAGAGGAGAGNGGAGNGGAGNGGAGSGGAGVGGDAGGAGAGGAGAGGAGAGGAGAGGAGAGGAGAGGAGGAGVGGAGGAGAAGASGGGAAGAGGQGCGSPADCDDANPCTTDSCEATLCKHVALADDTATPGVTPDPDDCKQSVCKGGKVTLAPAASETGDDGNLCTTDSCSAAGAPQHTPLTGPITCDQALPSNVCVNGTCKPNTCGDKVIAGGEECDGTNLGGQTCQGLGYAAPGALACMPTTCKFLTIGCLSAGDLVITEVLYDANTTEPASEWIELYNASSSPIDLFGLNIVRSPSASSNTHTVIKSVVVAPGAYVVLGSSTEPSQNGGAQVAYAWGNDISLSNSSTNTITIGFGATDIDKMSYTASASYSGKSYSLKSGMLSATDNDSAANFCAGKTPYGPGGLGTPGAANDCP